MSHRILAVLRGVRLDTIGQRVAEARQRISMSQYALAKALGVSPAYIQRLEKDEIKTPAIDKLRRMAVVLGVPVSYLLGEDVPLQASDEDEALNRRWSARLTDMPPGTAEAMMRQYRELPDDLKAHVMEVIKDLWRREQARIGLAQQEQEKQKSGQTRIAEEQSAYTTDGGREGDK